MKQNSDIQLRADSCPPTAAKPFVGSSALSVVHYFVIKCFDKKSNGNLIEFLQWSNLRFELRCKYDWYFKYRAALLQVKYPKYTVETYWGNEPAQGRTKEQIREALIRSKKSKITEYKNKLQKAKENWNSLFPIEDDLQYKKAVAKIVNLENELLSM